jgi:hypothetical protein
MSITGNPETGGRPLSTADLAAAARRRDAQVDDNEEPVLNEARPSASSDREERIQPQTASGAEAQQRTIRRDAETRRDVEQKISAGSEAPSGADTAARSGEALEALFTPDLAQTYRSQWTSIQSGFVDDPRQAVRRGDELVAQIMTNLADTFAQERHRVEAQLDSTTEGSTEDLRVTLRRYRSFFERLLSL